jgi:hypothetical protein
MARQGVMAIGTTRPYFPQAVFGPIAMALVVSSVVAGNASAARAVTLTAAGLFAWTLVEYLLHRFAFHARGVIGHEHRMHHDEPNDPEYVAAPLVIAFPLFIVLGALFWAVTRRWQDAGLLSAGLAMGYMLYEQAHYRSHHRPARTRLGKFLKRYHMIHHFQDSRNYFGVSSPLWDWVFRTRPHHPKL